jgi:hypothetical protein
MSYEFMTFIFLIFYLILKHVLFGSIENTLLLFVIGVIRGGIFVCMSTFYDVDGDGS